MAGNTVGHRLYNRRPQTRDASNGLEGDVLYWMVRGNTPAAALSLKGSAMDDGSVFPDIGAIHPEFGNKLLVSSIDAEETVGSADETFQVMRVSYTVDGNSFSGQPPDITSPTYTSTGFETRRLDVTIPTFALAWDYTYALGPANPPFAQEPILKKIGRFIQQDRTVTLVGSQYVREVAFQNFTQASANAIEEQTGNIHTLGGKKWLFEGGSARQVTKEGWVISYRWIRDPGNPIPVFPTPPGALIIIGPSTARLPFQQYQINWIQPPTNDPGVLPDEDPTTSLIPIITAADFGNEDAGGWANLPGIGANP